MLYLMTALMLALGLELRKNKAVTGLICIFLWVLFGWSYGNADYNIHLRKYEEYQALSWQTEPLYSMLMRVFNTMGLSYRFFLIAFGAFVLYAYVRFAIKHTEYVNFVLSIYMVFPLCMDVTMVRYTLATAVVLFGISSLFSNERMATIKFVIIVGIASLIHLSAILLLLLILPKYFSRKKLISIVGIGCVAIAALSSVIFAFAEKLTAITFLNVGAKLRIVLTAARMRYDASAQIKYGAKILLIFIMYAFVYYLISNWARSRYRPEIENNLRVLDRIFDMNITLLLTIPLVVYSADVFRTQLSLSIVNYVGIAQYFEMRKKLNNKACRSGTISLQTIMVVGGTVLYAFAGLYLWVLSSTNIDSVFRALFENNVLFY